MASRVKEAVREILRRAGFDVRRVSKMRLGLDIDYDTARLAAPGRVIFDVGANIGQTTVVYKKIFPDSRVHAFEPDSVAYAHARERLANLAGVTLNPVAVGNFVGTTRFFEYDQSVMSSRLSPANASWSPPKRSAEVPITTIDEYCRLNRIEHIDLLKIDAQGTDQDVLEGAEQMIRARVVTIVRAELTFSPIYEAQFDPLRSMAWMLDRGYAIVSLYNLSYRNDALSWMDVLYRQRQ